MLASRKLASLVRRRLRLQRWLDAAALSAMAAMSAAVPAMAVARLLGHGGEAIAVGVAAVAAAVTWVTWGRRHPEPGERSAAALADERLGLQSRTLTAIELGRRVDAFAQAAVADAERVATGQFARVPAAFPLRRPPLAVWVPVAASVVALVGWLWPVRVPVAASDAVTVSTDPARAVRDADAAESSLREAVRLLEDSPEAAEALRETLANMERAGDRADHSADPAAREAEAGERAAALGERIEERLRTPELQGVEAVADMLARLPELPGQGREVSQALKSGDLDRARSELERLARESSGADPEAAEAARKALEALASTLEQASRDTTAAEKALREAGMDPDLAKDLPQAMQAAQRDPSLTPERRQDLQRKLESCRNASSECRSLAQSARECRNGSSGSASSQLSRAAADRRMRQALARSLGQCRSGRSLGWSMPWDRPRGGGGSNGSPDKGGRQAGTAGSPRIDGQTEPLPEDAFARTRESAGDGDPLDRAVARDLVRGTAAAVDERSTAELKAAAAKVEVGLEEGSEEDPVPGRLKDAHRRYFEQWKRRLEGGAPPGGGP